MTRILPRLVVLLVALGVTTQAQSPKASIADFAWLAGCWVASVRGRHVDEMWMKPAAGIMLGTARNIPLGKGGALEFEFTQIREDKDGSIYYIAKPSGQAEASFKLIKLENREAVFENLKHDFPQRVIYRLESEGSLFARVEATVDGQVKGIDYPYKRSKCE